MLPPFSFILEYDPLGSNNGSNREGFEIEGIEALRLPRLFQ